MATAISFSRRYLVILIFPIIVAVAPLLPTPFAAAQTQSESLDGYCRGAFGTDWFGSKSTETGGPMCTQRTHGGRGLKHRPVDEATLCPDGSVTMSESGSMYTCRDRPAADAGPQDFNAYCRDKNGPDWIGTTHRLTGAPLCALQRGLSVVHRAVDEGDLCAGGSPTFNQAGTSYECSGGTQTASNKGGLGKSNDGKGQGGSQLGSDQGGGSSGGSQTGEGDGETGNGSGGMTAHTRSEGDCGDDWPSADVSRYMQFRIDQMLTLEPGYNVGPLVLSIEDHPYFQHWMNVYETNLERLAGVDCVNRNDFEAYLAEEKKKHLLGWWNYWRFENMRQNRTRYREGPTMGQSYELSNGELAHDHVPATWSAVDGVIEQARQVRFYPIELGRREYIIGTVTIDDQAIFDNRANTNFDFRQAEMDVESLTGTLDENQRRYEAALPGFEATMTALDAEAERANQRFEAVVRAEQTERAPGAGERQRDDYLARIARLKQRNATIAERIAYLRDDDPANAEIRQARIDDLAAEAQTNSDEIARLDQAVFDLVKPVRTDTQQAAVDRAMQARIDTLADISRRRKVALDRLERDHRPYRDAQEKLDAAIETLARARIDYEDAHNRPRLPIAEIRTDHFLRTYVGFRPKLTELDKAIAKAVDLVRQARQQRKLAREFMLEAGIGAELAGRSFAKWAAVSYFAQAGVEVIDAMHSAAKDVKDYGLHGFVAKSFLYTIPSKVIFPPSYYDGYEPMMAQVRVGEEGPSLWEEVTAGALGTKVKKTAGKSLQKTLVKQAVTGRLKHVQVRTLEKTLKEGVKVFMRSPGQGSFDKIGEDLAALKKKSDVFKDMVGKNGFKSMAKSFGKALGKEMAKSVLKETAKRQVAHLLTDDEWAKYMGAQIQLANAVQFFRNTRDPLNLAEAALAELRAARAELVDRFDADAGSLDESNDQFFPKDGYTFTIVLAEEDPIRKAAFRAEVTLDGRPLEGVGADEDGNPRFKVPAGGGQYFDNPDLPDELPLAITFEHAGTQTRVFQQ